MWQRSVLVCGLLFVLACARETPSQFELRSSVSEAPNKQAPVSSSAPGSGMSALSSSPSLDAGSPQPSGSADRASTKIPQPTQTQRPPTQLSETQLSETQPPQAQSDRKRVQADTDPENDRVVGPPDILPDCEQRLTELGVQFKPAKLPLKRTPNGAIACGSEQVVSYQVGPEKIRYTPPPVLTCPMALALAHFERIAQAEAERTIGHRIRRIEQKGTYNCRRMVRFQLASEHSYANAIDLSVFTLQNGRRISVKQHFGALDRPATTAESQFLRGLSRRLFDENVFSVVLTPYWDTLHHDHLHLDLARYRADGTR